jgi:hypothetical protein
MAVSAIFWTTVNQRSGGLLIQSRGHSCRCSASRSTQEGGNDPVSDTDADRHDDISHNGSSGFGGIAGSAEMGDLGDVISESTNVDLKAAVRCHRADRAGEVSIYEKRHLRKYRKLLPLQAGEFQQSWRGRRISLIVD